MPITQQQIQAAQVLQQAAARDCSAQVRLIAGPGTGKSFSIEERVCWLLEQNVRTRSIAAISFTRASSIELRTRIHAACVARNHNHGVDVRVSTLHSLALRILRAAGLLQRYPADPLVLDDFELETIFDAEFGHVQHIGKRRREEIRREREAFWSTGIWNPANYVAPEPPITAAERLSFELFHGPRTQTYSCVLPGEIVRQCLDSILAGILDPVALIHLEHLIVDEYQDLNPIDQQFISELIARGVTTFVAGDDDQSVYSFRYASPEGIQEFTTTYPTAGQHTLTDCFRCSQRIVAAANRLINANAAPHRIPKVLASLYTASVPAVDGNMLRWQFRSSVAESAAIATSCAALIAAGLDPRQILVLLSNQRELLPGMVGALNEAGVAYESPRSEGFLDLELGRFVLGLVRIVCDTNDYVAHRLVLGLRPGVGVTTTNGIAEAVIDNHLNFHNMFYNPLPPDLIRGKKLSALNHARHVCAQIVGWRGDETLAQHSADIGALINYTFGAGEVQNWDQYAAQLPQGMTLEEFRDWLWADSDDRKLTALNAVYTRLNQPIPQAAVLPPRIRIMSMHGAKGLSARVVFIPGLEEALFPGPWRQPYPGLVLEAARLLYVSITRARAACIVSYATRRVIQGQVVRSVPSRFTNNLDGAFVARAAGLIGPEVQQIMNDTAQL